MLRAEENEKRGLGYQNLIHFKLVAVKEFFYKINGFTFEEYFESQSQLPEQRELVEQERGNLNDEDDVVAVEDGGNYEEDEYANEV